MPRDPFDLAHFYGEEYALEEKRQGFIQPSGAQDIGYAENVFRNVTGRSVLSDKDREQADAMAREWRAGYDDRWSLIEDELRDQQ